MKSEGFKTIPCEVKELSFLFQKDKDVHVPTPREKLSEKKTYEGSFLEAPLGAFKDEGSLMLNCDS